MKEMISPDELIIEKLTEDHDVSKFDCGDDELNGFLCENSLPEMKAQMNVTYVCKYESTIVSYFTLSSDSIKLTTEDQSHFEKKGIGYRQFPALKIGRLAVDEKFKNRGVGTEIILRVVGCIFRLSDRVGMRFISVDSYVDSADFYRKNNFIELVKRNRKKRYTAMYFDPFRPYD